MAYVMPHIGVLLYKWDLVSQLLSQHPNGVHVGGQREVRLPIRNFWRNVAERPGKQIHGQCQVSLTLSKSPTTALSCDVMEMFEGLMFE